MARIYNSVFIDETPTVRHMVLPSIDDKRTVVIHINEIVSIFVSENAEQILQALITEFTSVLNTLKEES